MTITIFVNPVCLSKFVEVTSILEKLELENNYYFQPNDLDFTETFNSSYVWINMEISEYLKLKYCIRCISQMAY